VTQRLSALARAHREAARAQRILTLAQRGPETGKRRSGPDHGRPRGVRSTVGTGGALFAAGGGLKVQGNLNNLSMDRALSVIVVLAV